jgi:hypothetical protein
VVYGPQHPKSFKGQPLCQYKPIGDLVETYQKLQRRKVQYSTLLQLEAKTLLVFLPFDKSRIVICTSLTTLLFPLLHISTVYCVAGHVERSPDRAHGDILRSDSRFFLDPCFGIWSIVLPSLLGNGHVDPVAAKILYGIMFPLRLAYPPSCEIDLRRTARNDILITGKAGIHSILPLQPPSDIASAFRGAVAFAVSVTADLVGTIMDRKKMTKWFQAITEFKAYLDMSGVGEELEEAIMKPLLRGRLLVNVKILNDVQETMYADRG